MSKELKFIAIIILITASLWRFQSSTNKEPEISGSLPPTTTMTSSSLEVPPVQRTYQGESFTYADAQLTPIAEFSMTGRVIAKREYGDNKEQYSKTDLGIVWGNMALDEVLSEIRFSQSNRFLYWRAQKLPLPRDEITRSSANIHLIPKDALIQNEVDDIREGDIVELKGKLVQLSRDDGFYWNSSTSRKDEGNGACELLFVEVINIR